MMKIRIMNRDRAVLWVVIATALLILITARYFHHKLEVLNQRIEKLNHHE